MTRAGAAALDARAAEPQPEQRYSLREAAKILEVPESRLRALARAGLLAPQRGPIGPLTFGFRDLLLLRTTKGLLESGVPMRRIRHVWSSLREQLAADVPLTSVTIRADGEHVVASDGSSAWQPDSGQFVLDFEASEIAVRARSSARGAAAAASAPQGGHTGAEPVESAAGPLVAHLTPLVTRPQPHPAGPASPSTRAEPGAVRFRMRSLDAASPPSEAASDEETERSVEEWYELALERESDSPAEAIEAYRRTLARDPTMADAHVNLGRLYHLAGERGRAEAHYRDAVRLAPDDPVPHFNLGVLMEEQGRREAAAHAYLQAVSRDPDFADAHCNLGLLLESLGRRQEAARHLMAARDLYRST